MSGFEIVQEPPLTLRSVLGRVFSTLKERPGLFGALGSLHFLASLALAALTTPLTRMPPGRAALPCLILFLAYIFLSTWLQGALIFAGLKNIFDGDVSFGEALSESFAKIKSLLGGFLALFALVLVLALAGVLLAKLFHPLPALALAAGGLLWMGVSLLLYIPACLVEDLGAVEALRRSLDLTAGFRLKIFGLTLALGFIIGFAVGFPLGFLFVLLGRFGSAAALAAVIQLMNFFMSVMTVTAASVQIGVLYIDLREIQEGA